MVARPTSTQRLQALVQRTRKADLDHELSRITDDGPPAGDSRTRRLLRALRGELTANAGAIRCVRLSVDMRPIDRVAARVLRGREGGR